MFSVIYIKLHFKRKQICYLFQDSVLVHSLWRKVRERSSSAALPLCSFVLISHLFPRASPAWGSLGACYKGKFLELIGPTESELGVVRGGFERIHNLNKLSRWYFSHNKVWEQLQVCLFIGPCFESVVLKPGYV